MEKCETVETYKLTIELETKRRENQQMAPNEMDLNMASDQPSSIEILALSLVREYLSRKVRFICQHFIYCNICLLYTSPSPRDKRQSRMPSSA